MRHVSRLALASSSLLSLLTAQKPLAERLRATGTRTVAFSARTRPNACGDGIKSYSDGLSGPRTRFYDGMLLTHEPWDTRIAPCEPGPMRVSVRMVEGVPSWLRIAVGPLPVLGDTVLDLGTGTRRARRATFCESLVRGGEGRTSVDACCRSCVLDSFAALGRARRRGARQRRACSAIVAARPISWRALRRARCRAKASTRTRQPSAARPCTRSRGKRERRGRSRAGAA